MTWAYHPETKGGFSDCDEKSASRFARCNPLPPCGGGLGWGCGAGCALLVFVHAELECARFTQHSDRCGKEALVAASLKAAARQPLPPSGADRTLHRRFLLSRRAPRHRGGWWAA